MTDARTLLASDGLRIDDGGVAVVEGLSFRVAGPLALVLGAPAALFEAASGRRRASGGQLLVAGLPSSDAVRRGAVSPCPLDPPLPLRWSPLEYATWCARLAGHPRGEARARAASALDRVQLAFAARKSIERLPVAGRRAVALASTLACGGHLVLLEDPLAGLPEETAEAHARILLDALSGHDVVVFAPKIRLTSALALAAADACVIDGRSVVAQGAPAALASQARTFALRAEGLPEAVSALAAKVAARGGTLSTTGASRLAVDLGESLTTAELLGLALAEDVLVVELRPVAAAFA